MSTCRPASLALLLLLCLAVWTDTSAAAKKRNLERCDSGRQCQSGICFKKACRQVQKGAENIIVRRTDPAWLKYKRTFRVQEVQINCPPASATQTGIVEKIIVDEATCCYKPPGAKRCINVGRYVETLSLRCWGIDPRSTEPKAGIAGGSNGGSVCKKGAQIFPIKSRRSTKRTETGWQGKNAGFTEVWVTAPQSDIVGGWPYKACRFPLTDCRRAIPPAGRPSALTCPRGTSVAGLVVALLSSFGETFVGVEGIVCQDPLGWLS